MCTHYFMSMLPTTYQEHALCCAGICVCGQLLDAWGQQILTQSCTAARSHTVIQAKRNRQHIIVAPLPGATLWF